MQILIVEDDFLIASDLEAKLNELGYPNVHIAYDLDEAGKLLDTASPDFAILDVNLGAQPVFPLAERLQVQKIPFVFSTGVARDAFPEQWRRYPMIPKPLEDRLLVATLQVLGLHRPERQAKL